MQPHPVLQFYKVIALSTDSHDLSRSTEPELNCSATVINVKKAENSMPENVLNSIADEVVGKLTNWSEALGNEPYQHSAILQPMFLEVLHKISVEINIQCEAREYQEADFRAEIEMPLRSNFNVGVPSRNI